MTDEDLAYLHDAFRHWARSGYAPELVAEAEERLRDLLGAAPPKAVVAQLRAFAQACLDEQRAAEATWDGPTLNDRLSEAFADLEDGGVVALEDAGYSVADGWEDAATAAEELDDVRGAVFFHGQDVEAAVRGEGLWLSFGVLGRKDAAASEAIGREVVSVLAEHGVPTTWDGAARSRIHIPPFAWQRRQFTESPL
jgi:hypothetical protein